MRPVRKYEAGQMLCLDGHEVVVPDNFADYRDAKSLLVRNLGEYCSYCEAHITAYRDIQVEHIQPKSLLPYAGLKDCWSNLLLSCSICNGRDNKGNKDVIVGKVHLPHLNNTFLSLQYLKGGVVRVNPSLQDDSRLHAEELCELLGLCKKPSEAAPSDDRWRKRLDVWNQAERYLEKYCDGKADVETIIDLAKAEGHWSIWFTVFDGKDDVRKALIDSFPGTEISCFDASLHYSPINRNPDNVEDPV